MSESHDIQKHIKVYYAVFAALLIFTVVTVSVSYIHFGVLAAVTVGGIPPVEVTVISSR